MMCNARTSLVRDFRLGNQVIGCQKPQQIANKVCLEADIANFGTETSEPAVVLGLLFLLGFRRSEAYLSTGKIFAVESRGRPLSGPVCTQSVHDILMVLRQSVRHMRQPEKTLLSQTRGRVRKVVRTSCAASLER
jgi:hypothetical protein